MSPDMSDVEDHVEAIMKDPAHMNQDFNVRLERMAIRH